MQAIAGDEATVIVHERHQVDPAVLPLQGKGKQVGLPQLIGRGAFEGADFVRMRPGRDFLVGQPRFTQDRGHGGGAGRQGWTTHEHVADALTAPVRIGLFEHQNRALGQLRQARSARSAFGSVQQPGRPLFFEALLPGE
jgi:hypothetical protein